MTQPPVQTIEIELQGRTSFPHSDGIGSDSESGGPVNNPVFTI